MPCPMCKRDHPQTIPLALGVLARTPGLLEMLVNRTSPIRLAKRPEPDKWSAKEIIGHLADCEWVFGVRYRKIAAEPGTALPAFEQDAWAAQLGHAKAAIKPTLATFAALRAANVALLKSLPALAWEQTAVHPTYGPLGIRDLVLHIATHDATHLSRLEDLCPPSAGKKPGRTARRKSVSRRR
jgi:hypothetical protein